MKILHHAMKLGPRNLETDGDRIVTFNLDLPYFVADPINIKKMPGKGRRWQGVRITEQREGIRMV